MKTTLDARSKFLMLLEERIKLAGSVTSETAYIVVRERFKELFPPYEVDVMPYDHENSRTDLAAGYDYKEFEKHPILKKFNDDFYNLIKTAYDTKKPLPKVSILMEMIENLNIHPRLKMISAFSLQIKYNQFKKDFNERDIYLNLKKHAESDDPNALLKYVSELKNERDKQNSESPGGNPLGGISANKGGIVDVPESPGNDQKTDGGSDSSIKSN